MATPGVAVLNVADVPRLNTAGNPRIDETDIRAVLRLAPGRSFWVPATGEFILVGPWRSRVELPYIHTLWSFDHDDALIDAAVRASGRAGAAALIMLETGERRTPTFYHRQGFDRIETIRTYQHTEPSVLARQYDSGVQRFVRVTELDRTVLADVEAIDHAAFPWFWWNSAREFATYLAFPGVEVWAGMQRDRVVSYFGFTAYHHWAHLDRIAVAPDAQSVGLGRSAVAFAAHRMVTGSASRIGLSTQASNRISRHLYESAGFQHTRHADYDVYGIVIAADPVYRIASG